MELEDNINTNKNKATNNGNKGSKTEGNLWNDILKESSTKKDLEQSHIFIFGDKNTGKKSLIKSINKDILNKTEIDESFKRSLKVEDTVSKFAMIDYVYLNIKKINESDSDVIGKINVWIINDILEKGIFETIFKPEYLMKSMCLIIVDLSRPWEILDSLRKWMNYIYDSFASLLMKVPLEKQEELREKIVEYLKLYEDPQVDDEGNTKKERMTEETIRLKKSMQLKDGLLKTNLGIPTMIVVNKSDVISSNNEKKRFDEDSEFILKHIRSFAINYAATTIYTSSKYNYNLNILYEYILHRIYNFDFFSKTNVIDKDSYFIPSGYDSVSVLKGFDTNEDLEKFYEERIPKIKIKGTLKEDEVYCEDLQVLLNKYRSGKRVVTNTIEINNDKDEKNHERQLITPGKDLSQRKIGTNSSTDFSIFLKDSASKKEDLISPDKKVIESIKKQDTKKLIKEGDEKGGKSKDLMKKINALKNRKTNNQENK